MSVKKYGKLSAAEIRLLLSRQEHAKKAIDGRISLYEKRILGFKREKTANTRESTIMLTRLKEAVEREKVRPAMPAKFHRWNMRRVGNRVLFGCGDIAVNKQDLQSFLSIETAIGRNWEKHELQNAHNNSFRVASNIYVNDTLPVSYIGRFNITRSIVRGTSKYVFGCGEVALTRAQVSLFYRIYAAQGIYSGGAAHFTKRRNATISMAKKLLKILN